MTLLTLQDIVDNLDLKTLTDPKEFQQVTPTSGYASDLLSCVMAGAKGQSGWVTLQAHANVVAVSALLEVSAVIITENTMPEQAVIDKANQEGIILLSTSQPTFYVVGKLWDMGLRE